MKSQKILSILLLVLLAACGPSQYGGQARSGGLGHVVFYITDAAEASQITSVKVTVDSVSVHSAAEGWVEVNPPGTVRTYDLIALHNAGSQEIIADTLLHEGTYEQLRLHISRVVVTDATGDHDAKLPSKELKLVRPFTVRADQTTTATFDFDADKSVHMTGQGEYTMMPVVQLEIEGRTEVEVGNGVEVENEIEVQTGQQHSNNGRY